MEMQNKAAASEDDAPECVQSDAGDGYNGVYISKFSSVANVGGSETGDSEPHLTTINELKKLVDLLTEQDKDESGDVQTAYYSNSQNNSEGEIHTIWKEILEGNKEAVSEWIATTKESGGDINEVDDGYLNALHYAIIFKKTALVKLLLSKGADYRYPATRFQLLPLQLAIIGAEPFEEAIDLLIQYSGDSTFINMTSNKQGTALDLAVFIRNDKAVKTLIQKRANPCLCWQSKTSLERAMEIREKNMVKCMLGIDNNMVDIAKLKKKDRCGEGESSTHKHNPFNSLIRIFPDLAEVVMDHCIQTVREPHDAKYEVTFDISLFENDGKNTEEQGQPCLRIPSLFTRYWDNNYRKKEQYPLYDVMQSNKASLLQHPLVQALLKKKLSLYFWLTYFCNSSTFVALFIILVLFVLYVPNPNTEKCLEFFANNSTIFIPQMNKCSSILPPGRARLLLSLKIVAALLVIMRILIAVYSMIYQKILSFFFQVDNLAELMQYLSTCIFLFLVKQQNCFCPTTIAWRAGVLSVAMSCLVLILWSEIFPLIGVFVIILKKIVFSFLKVSIFGLALIAAFGFTFYMLFSRPSSDDDVSNYSNPLRAILGLVPFTAGDIAIENVFYSDPPLYKRAYEDVAFFIWLSGVIILGILFNNMLVGLAVGDVREILHEAKNTKIKKKIHLVLVFEESLPNCLYKIAIWRKPISIKPNKIVALRCLNCLDYFNIKFLARFELNRMDYIQAVPEVVERTQLHGIKQERGHLKDTRDEIQIILKRLYKN